MTTYYIECGDINDSIELDESQFDEMTDAVLEAATRILENYFNEELRECFISVLTFGYPEHLKNNKEEHIIMLTSQIAANAGNFEVSNELNVLMKQIENEETEK